MNQENPHVERTVYRAGKLPRTARVEVGEAKRLNEMETKPNLKKVPTNEVSYVRAADFADKIIVLMPDGFDPLLLSTSTWALVQTSQCQAINLEETLIKPVGVKMYCSCVRQCSVGSQSR
jgi:hypothetical protein